VAVGSETWTVGVLVLTNNGDRPGLTIGGVELGPLLEIPMAPNTNDGSCIVVVATDAPLLPHQRDRLAMRGLLGLTRAGASAGNTSGELAIAFSTATRIPLDLSEGPTITVRAMADGFNRVYNALFLGEGGRGCGRGRSLRRGAPGDGASVGARTGQWHPPLRSGGGGRPPERAPYNDLIEAPHRVGWPAILDRDRDG
jgi:peptidase S58-like protein